MRDKVPAKVGRAELDLLSPGDISHDLRPDDAIFPSGSNGPVRPDLKDQRARLAEILVGEVRNRSVNAFARALQ
jgi:hypothetical protein